MLSRNIFLSFRQSINNLLILTDDSRNALFTLPDTILYRCVLKRPKSRSLAGFSVRFTSRGVFSGNSICITEVGNVGGLSFSSFTLTTTRMLSPLSGIATSEYEALVSRSSTTLVLTSPVVWSMARSESTELPGTGTIRYGGPLPTACGKSPMKPIWCPTGTPSDTSSSLTNSQLVGWLLSSSSHMMLQKSLLINILFAAFILALQFIPSDALTFGEG